MNRKQDRNKLNPQKYKSHKALAIYEHLRQAHKSIKQIWRDFPEIMDSPEFAFWETAVDAADNTLYLAEEYFSGEAS